MNYSRRHFLQTSSLLLAGSFISSAFKYDHALNIAFSTLGCPDWPFEKIVTFAHEQNIRGIEVRGIMGQMDLPLCPEFIDKHAIKKTMKQMRSKGLQFVNLGSSAEMHVTDADKSNKGMDEARRFIDLAEKINCPYIRIFPNKLLKEVAKEITLQRITERFHQLADYAKTKNVTVLMETHGDLVYADDVVKVIKDVNHSNAALIWDITNMWTITKEPVEEVADKLYPWIKHVHVKDAKTVDGKLQYVLLGEGEVPITKAMSYLTQRGYRGFYSFEWEKLWHPELMDPGIAIADFASKME
jgi:sugar phosphate isomerase/epimerase